MAICSNFRGGGASIMRHDRDIIGIVGGVGPYAGLDLMRKIFDQTAAGSDQDYPAVIHMSFSSDIAPRPEFLLGASQVNPGPALGRVMVRLARAGATLIAMPCNTAHAEPILSAALRELDESLRGGTFSRPVRFFSLLEAVVDALKQCLPVTSGRRRVGILSTKATFETGLYQRCLEPEGYVPVFPDSMGREGVQSAINHPGFGIKTHANPVAGQARDLLLAAARALADQKAEAILLACTELPLALPENRLFGLPVLDSTSLLARALVRAAAPERLKPLPD